MKILLAEPTISYWKAENPLLFDHLHKDFALYLVVWSKELSDSFTLVISPPSASPIITTLPEEPNPTGLDLTVFG